MNLWCFQKHRQRATAERGVLQLSLPRVWFGGSVITALAGTIVVTPYVIPWGKNNPRLAKHGQPSSIQINTYGQLSRSITKWGLMGTKKVPDACSFPHVSVVSVLNSRQRQIVTGGCVCGRGDNIGGIQVSNFVPWEYEVLRDYFFPFLNTLLFLSFLFNLLG